MTAFGKSKWNRYAWRAGILLALAPVVAGAEEWPDWTYDLQIHGFFSQGYVKSSDNSFYGDSEEGSFDFREIGLNASLRLGQRWLVSAQLLSHKAGEMTDGRIGLDYGLVDYTLVADEHRRMGVIAGRFKNPLGLYNDTRDVPFTRPSVFLPQSIYWDKLRNIMLSADGGQVYAEFYRGRHGLDLQLGGGYLNTDDNLEWAYLGNDWGGELGNNSTALVGRALYELDDGRLRLALSGVTTAMEFEPAPTDPIGAGTMAVDYLIGSFQYNAEDWSLTAEYMREPVEWRGFSFPLQMDKGTAEGYYLQGTYRITQDWEVLLRYDASFLNRDDRDGRKQSERAGVPAHRFYSHTWSLGLTWDIDDAMMLRAQYDWIDGTGFLSAKENPNPFAMERYWNMFSLLFSVGF